MNENYLQNSDIEGTWKAAYAAQESDFDPNADPDEQATITFENGKLFGSDPYGGIFHGEYSLIEGKFEATINATTNHEDKTSVFEGLDFPFMLHLSGQYSSPDYFSLVGYVVGMPERKMVINCRRYK